ncbi:MAG: hypothetical protein UHM08_08830 [Bacteroidales bacterium]|nr:hypothetical protein [Bacteroidales bacterium]
MNPVADISTEIPVPSSTPLIVQPPALPVVPVFEPIVTVAPSIGLVPSFTVKDRSLVTGSGVGSGEGLSPSNAFNLSSWSCKTFATAKGFNFLPSIIVSFILLNFL